MIYNDIDLIEIAANDVDLTMFEGRNINVEKASDGG